MTTPMWTYDKPPKSFAPGQTIIANAYGWVDEATGEILVGIPQMAGKSRQNVISAAIAAAHVTTGDVINIVVTFEAAVTVTGTPRVRLKGGNGTFYNANYLSGSGTTALTFRYTTVGTEVTPLKVQQDIVLNGGTIVFTSDSLAAQKAISNYSTVSTHFYKNTVAPTSGSFGASANIDLVVTFTDGNVVVVGTPRLVLVDGSSGTHFANKLSSTGNTVTFRYTVVGTETSPFTLQQNIDMNGGSIKVGGVDVQTKITNYATVSLIRS
jgi:hypothetical protein